MRTLAASLYQFFGPDLFAEAVISAASAGIVYWLGRKAGR